MIRLGSEGGAGREAPQTDRSKQVVAERPGHRYVGATRPKDPVLPDPARSLRAEAFVDPSNRVAAELIAVVVAVTRGEPLVLTIGGSPALPSGPFQTTHRS